MIVVVEFFDALLLRWAGFFGKDALNARAVFRNVVERVDILIAINFYLLSSFQHHCTNGSAR